MSWYNLYTESGRVGFGTFGVRGFGVGVGGGGMYEGDATLDDPAGGVVLNAVGTVGVVAAGAATPPLL